MCSYVLKAGRLIAPVIERLGAVAGFDWCIEALTGAHHSGLASEVALAKAAWFLNHQAFGDAVSVLKVCPSGAHSALPSCPLTAACFAACTAVVLVVCSGH